jgi:hypothetical protein
MVFNALITTLYIVIGNFMALITLVGKFVDIKSLSVDVC